VSLLAGVAPRLAGLLAQHGAAIAAGVLSGAMVGGAGVATGVIPTGGSHAASTRALLACPGSGREVARIASGQPILVTARSADGNWLQVYVGEPGVDSGWASADALKLRDAASSLPVADCGVQPSGAPTPGPVASPPPPSQIALPTATAGPSPSPTPKPTPTPRPTVKPTKSPKPTPVPTSVKDANPPVISGLYANNNGTHCFSDFADLDVTVTDADSGDTLTVAVHVVPASGTPIDDVFSGGPPDWEYSFYTGGLDWTSGVVRWTVTATDSTGNITKVSSSSNSSDPSWIWYEKNGPCPTP
jgi:uncharacterized protein YraI